MGHDSELRTHTLKPGMEIGEDHSDVENELEKVE